jgi:ABC-type thiamine transport system ATPase subunit
MPSAAPEIAEILRLVLGWAWTYVIVAELIGSSSGIGHMIIDSQALLATGQIIFGIIVIGIIGLISDFAVQGCQPAPVSVEHHLSKLVIDNVSRIFPAVRGGTPTRALEPTNRSVARQRLHHHPRPVRLRQVHAAAHGRRAGDADHRPHPARRQGDHRPGADRGMVFQSYTLFPWLTVSRTSPSACASAASERERNDIAARLAGEGGPHQLRQSFSEAALRRHAAAHRDRARARQRSEDPAARRAVRRARQPDPRLMQELLLGIWERERKTVLFVTHDIEEAIFLASRTVVMSARPGRIKADIAVDLPHPRHYTIKTSPELKLHHAQRHRRARRILLRWALGASAGDELSALDRAFHVTIAGILGNGVLVRFVGELFDQRINPYFRSSPAISRTPSHGAKP